MKLRPMAVCLIFTCPGPGLPTSTSSRFIVSGPPFSCIWIDFDICSPLRFKPATIMSDGRKVDESASIHLDGGGERCVGEERLIEGRLPYIRDVRHGPAGPLFLVTHRDRGGLFRLEPA